MSGTQTRLAFALALAFEVALFAPLTAHATEPYQRHCSEDTCLQRKIHAMAVVKDVYTYQAGDGLEHRVVRYDDGSVVSILVTPQKKGGCNKTTLEFSEQGPGVLKGTGCLRSEHQQPDVAISVTVRTTRLQPGAFLSVSGLVIWRTGIDQQGNYHEIASEPMSFRYSPEVQ